MGKRRKKDYYGPRNEYVFSPEKPDFRVLAKKWDISYDTIRQASSDQKWPDQRDNFWRRVQDKKEKEIERRLAADMSDAVIDANKRHMTQGQVLQELGNALISKVQKLMAEDADLKLTDAARTAVRAVKEGAELERKALGLVETIMHVTMARDFGIRIVNVVAKYVDEPATLRNIRKDISGEIEKEEVKLEEYGIIDVGGVQR